MIALVLLVFIGVVWTAIAALALLLAWISYRWTDSPYDNENSNASPTLCIIEESSLQKDMIVDSREIEVRGAIGDVFREVFYNGTFIGRIVSLTSEDLPKNTYGYTPLPTSSTQWSEGVHPKYLWNNTGTSPIVVKVAEYWVKSENTARKKAIDYLVKTWAARKALNDVGMLFDRG